MNSLHKSSTMLGALVIAAATAFALPANAQQNYFQGKTINVIVPSGGGSGLDVMARTVVNSWKKHIPGSPTVVIKNQPSGRGGGTLNFVYEKGKPDGLTISWGPLGFVEVVNKKKGTRHVPEKMGYVGGFNNPRFVFVRSDIAPGVKKPADIVKPSKVFATGGRVPGSVPDLLANLTLELIGAKNRFISGYRGGSKIMKAVLANEIQGGAGSFPLYVRLGPSIKQGKVVPLWYHPTFKDDGTPIKIGAMPDVPAFTDVYREVHGKMPSGPAYETYKWFMNNMVSVSFALVTAPNTPDSILADLRTGFTKMVADPAFAASQKKQGVALEAISTEDGLKVLANYRNVPPAVKTELARLGKKGS